eukprot:scaffold363_cov56-Cylindrotheca_fusiformis.AAC.26
MIGSVVHGGALYRSYTLPKADGRGWEHPTTRWLTMLEYCAHRYSMFSLPPYRLLLNFATCHDAMGASRSFVMN